MVLTALVAVRAGRLRDYEGPDARFFFGGIPEDGGIVWCAPDSVVRFYEDTEEPTCVAKGDPRYRPAILSAGFGGR